MSFSGGRCNNGSLIAQGQGHSAAAHFEILWYMMMELASNVVVLLNLMVQLLNAESTIAQDSIHLFCDMPWEGRRQCWLHGVYE